MATKKGRSELITGVFTIGVIVAFVVVVFFLQGFSPAIVGARYTVFFDDVGGLSGAGAVIVAGQRVGRVDGIFTRPMPAGESAGGVEIEVQFVIEEKYAKTVVLPIDTQARVQAGGLFGGSDQIVLMLGRSPERVQPGQRLPMRGMPPTSIATLFQGAGDTMKELQSAIAKLTAVIGKDEFSQNIDKTLASLTSAVDTLDRGLKEMQPAFGKVGPTFDAAQELLSEIRALIERNNESIGELVKNLERASGRLDAIMADGPDGVPSLVRGLNGIAGNMDTLVAALNDLVLDNQVNFQVSLQNIRDASASLRVFARRIERDPSLLVWGSDEDEKVRTELDSRRAIPNVDELEIRNSGRRPRKESD